MALIVLSNSSVEILMLTGQVLEGRVFGRYLGQEGRALLNGIRALVGKTPQSLLTCPSSDKEPATTQEEGSHLPPMLVPRSWASGLRNSGKLIYAVYKPPSLQWIFCYSSWNQTSHRAHPTLCNEVAYWETGYSHNDKDGFKNMKKPDNSWGPPQQGNAGFFRVPAGTM